jgi:hypothetical protein
MNATSEMLTAFRRKIGRVRCLEQHIECPNCLYRSCQKSDVLLRFIVQPANRGSTLVCRNISFLAALPHCMCSRMSMQSASRVLQSPTRRASSVKLRSYPLTKLIKLCFGREPDELSDLDVDVLPVELSKESDVALFGHHPLC